MARRGRRPASPRSAPPLRRRRGTRAATIALSVLVLVGVPVLVVLLASGEGESEGTAAGADPHRPTAPFFAGTGDGVRPDGIGCTSEGRIVVRAAAHLDVFADGARVTVPAGIGEHATCTYWLHTRAADGVVAITSPQRRAFTLGDLFDIWGAPLTRTRVLAFGVGPRRPLRAFVAGRPFSGDPRRIRLVDGREIALVIGRRPAAVPSRFAFGGG